MYVERVQVENVRGFHGARNVDLTLPGPGWTVIAGRNGSGKTSLLRAIALTIADTGAAHKLAPDPRAWVSTGELRARAELYLPGQGVRRILWDLEVDGDFAGSRHGVFSAAYGPYRRLSGRASGRELGSVSPYVTLFDEDAALSEGVVWLVEQHLRAFEGKSGAAELKRAALRVLADGLLPDAYEVQDVDSDGLWVSYQGNRFPLREMSDGYRTVTALVVDLIRNIHDFYGSVELDQAEGVVLIDEVDAHLHVSWQKRIGPWFKAHFPKIQFIVTTHSPYVCQAADPGGLIRLPGPDEQQPPRVVSEELYERVAYGSGDDAVLSDLFGLDTPYSPEAVALREELAELEFKVASGQADERMTARWKELRELLTSSPVARVDEVAQRGEVEDR
ncbi:AAA family ATPase [Amycolatopsis sp. cg5]|uniref:AAA family ATPase n=1 Tax=Amycolatopsis sp. cg5 TaxID=3238802 RepID=UPI003525FA24